MLEKKEKRYGDVGGRFEGLFTILYYFSLMFLASFVDKKYKKIIVNFILIAGAIHSLYAIYQKMYLLNIAGFKDAAIFKNIFKITWVNGFTINPDFLGSFIIICLIYSISLFIDENKRSKSIIYFIYSTLFFIALLINNTQSCVLAFIICFILFFIYSIKNKRFKKIIFITIMIVSVTTILTKLNMSKVLKHLIKTGKEASQMAQGNMNDGFGNSRLNVWKRTLKVVPNHLLHGVGIDDYYHAFGDKPLVLTINGKPLLFDKAK